MLLGVRAFFREGRKGEKCAILPSAGSKGTGHPGKVTAPDRHDLIILGFTEHDYAVGDKI